MPQSPLVNVIATAIQKADSSYFNENYTKQAQAVIRAVEESGFVFTPKTASADIWQKAAEQMRTGRLKPDEHVKDVFETVIALMALR